MAACLLCPQVETRRVSCVGGGAPHGRRRRRADAAGACGQGSQREAHAAGPRAGAARAACLPRRAGEGAAEAAGACGQGNATCGLTGLLAVDVPLDGRGPTAIPAAETMSPVFTLWITLVAMYLGAPRPLGEGP
jgi:hypothetical protein